MRPHHYQNYLRTDLATECRARCNLEKISPHQVSFEEEKTGSMTISHLQIKSDQASKELKKPKGRYVTIGFTPPHYMTDEEKEALCSRLSDALYHLIKEVCPAFASALIVGLGNRDITADAIGPICLNEITVTRHLRSLDPHLFKAIGHLETSAITPGVLGQTGFESAGLILSAVNEARPDVVIVIDALAARSPQRLLSTIQLCDSGISPGSGVKNNRPSINKELLGVPVIALGVPTVVDSAVLIMDAIEKWGAEITSPQFESMLKDNQNLFVCPKEIDESVKILCPIISSAINLALTVKD